MTCNECKQYSACLERSREYPCREFRYDGGAAKREGQRIAEAKRVKENAKIQSKKNRS